MKNMAIKMLMNACAGLMLLGAGCQSKPNAGATASAKPLADTVIAKADLDRLREEYAPRLEPRRAPEVHDGPSKELKLIEFRGMKNGEDALADLKHALKVLAESKNASVSEWHEGAMYFSFHYRRNHVQGTVMCRLKARYLDEFQPQKWDILLSVVEKSDS